MTRAQRLHVLVAAFLAWTYAGFGIALFVLIHRPMMLDFLGRDADEATITRWFAWFQAAFLFGAAAGGWLFGWMGDRFGRRRALAGSVLCQAGCTFAAYTAKVPEGLLFMRFVACMGIGGIWPNAVALVSEAWPDASRPFLAGLLGAAANVGQVAMGFVGYTSEITSDSWRWTSLVAAIPAVLGVWMLGALPESVRWLKSRATPSPNVIGPLKEVLTPPLLGRTVLGICLAGIPVVGTAANGNWLVPWTDQVAE